MPNILSHFYRLVFIALRTWIRDIKKLSYNLSTYAGLAIFGKYLKQINFNFMIDPAFPVRSDNTNSDIVKSYMALLCLGKNDFEVIENFRDDSFFIRALDSSRFASNPTVRQSLDAHAGSQFDLSAQLN